MTGPVPFKHLRLTTWVPQVVVGDDNQPVTATAKHCAQFDVPVDQSYEGVILDAQQRWQLVEVLDECPPDCPAQSCPAP